MFQNLIPTLFLFASPMGGAHSACTQVDPCTLGLALAKQQPGVAILAAPGTYASVKAPSNKGGTATAPVWVISAGGQNAAKIIGTKADKAGFQCLGCHYMSIKGFEIAGQQNGVQFSQSGSDFANLVNDIEVEGNYIHDTIEDGVKISQGTNIEVMNNVIFNTGQQGIDFVNVWQGRAIDNDVSGARVSAAIFAKDGSKDIDFSNNHVHDLAGYATYGILCGGWSDPGFARPGSPNYEALNCSITSNYIEKVYGSAIGFLGASSSKATGNIIQTTTDVPGKTSSWSVFGVAPDNNTPKVLSIDITITGNLLTNSLVPNKRGEFLWDKQTQDPTRDRLIVSGNTSGPFTSFSGGPKAYGLWGAPAGLITTWQQP